MNLLTAPSWAYCEFSVVSRAERLRPRATAPEVVVDVSGLAADTLAMVPGKVCLGAKLITPLLAMESTFTLAVPC